MNPPAETPVAAPRLFLAPRLGPRSRSFLEWVAGNFRLYSYGRDGLSALVRSEIERAALSLTVVFLFEWWAWSLIWNSVFHRGALVADGMTFLACSVGLLFSGIVLSFEQGVITMDWSVPGFRAWCKRAAVLLLRILVIVGSAAATSQAVEILAFAHDISERVHQERVWEEIVSRVLQYQRLEDELAGGGQAAFYRGRLSASVQVADKAQNEKASAQQNADHVTAMLGQERSQLETLRKQLPALRTAETQSKEHLDQQARSFGVTDAAEQRRHSQIKEFRAAYDAAVGARAAKQNSIEQAASRIADLESKLDQAHGDVAGKAAILDTKIKEKTNADNLLLTFQKEVGTRLDELQRWIVRVADSGPDEKEFSSGSFQYSERPYSFAEQLRVLDDLWYGRPIQRRNFLSIRPDLLQQKLNLGDPAKIDEAGASSRQDRAAVVKRLYIALLALSLFVPLMGVLFKLTLHPQLTDYYSARYQASNGSVDAMQYVQEDERAGTKAMGYTAGN